MRKQFVIEAVMLAIYGELLNPSRPVEYVIPSSTVYELEEFLVNPEPIMPDPEDDRHVREVISDMIQYFREPFRRKKMEKHLVAPWSTVTFPYDDLVQFTIIKAEDQATWGELFDPIETEVLLTCLKVEAPLLTDQLDWETRLLEHMIPVQFYDIDDFQFALEDGIPLEDLRGL